MHISGMYVCVKLLLKKYTVKLKLIFQHFLTFCQTSSVEVKKYICNN